RAQPLRSTRAWAASPRSAAVECRRGTPGDAAQTRSTSTRSGAAALVPDAADDCAEYTCAQSVRASPPETTARTYCLARSGDQRPPTDHWRQRTRRAPPCHRRQRDRKSTRLNSSHVKTSYAVFCLKKK